MYLHSLKNILFRQRTRISCLHQYVMLVHKIVTTKNLVEQIIEQNSKIDCRIFKILQILLESIGTHNLLMTDD